VLHCQQVTISGFFRDIGLKVYWGHNVDLSASSTIAISYRFSNVIKSPSPAVSEILGPKHIGFSTFTFQDHVTSSVTWPFYSQWAICYWWSMGPKSLSL